ncbi:MAG: hypothetical protein IPG96_19190 [Proteobacteria bacterium]|nr:hypothetical protein [Pseudomonadota bacterium]
MDPLVERLVAANASRRSWREKLEWVAELCAAGPSVASDEQLRDVAIYLRFLGTGELPCAEDGRHFRPLHHARLAQRIHASLATLRHAGNAELVRRIVGWLPSYDGAFLAAEPLTRIRDIAHRNDIPSALKQEIKHTLQNKLHRCAGPEDLATSAALLARVTAPGAGCPPTFVRELRLFHAELEQFFGVGDLEAQLAPLLREPQLGLNQAALALQRAQQQALAWGATREDLLRELMALTALRELLQPWVVGTASALAQRCERVDLALERHAFLVASRLCSVLEATPEPAPWSCALRALGSLLEQLALSGVAAAEARAMGHDLRRWLAAPAGEPWLPLAWLAVAERAQGLVAERTARTLTQLAVRAEALGRALGVAPHALASYVEGELRGQLVFQLSKLAEWLEATLRREVGLSPWSAVVAGAALGRLVQVASLEELETGALPQVPHSDPVIACVDRATGDELLPPGVVGVLLGQPMALLSHLGVRARQHGVVFAAGSAAALQRLLQDAAAGATEPLRLTVRADGVSLQRPTAEPLRSRQPGAPAATVAAMGAGATGEADARWVLPLNEAVAERAGAKAVGLRWLSELAADHATLFRTAPTAIVPFTALERVIALQPLTWREALERCTTGELGGRPTEGARSDAASAAAEDRAAQLTALWQPVVVPPELLAGLLGALGADAALVVRSSADSEDRVGYTTAGLFRSVVNVRPEQLAGAIKQVWSSLWSARALRLRAQQPALAITPRMAVIVQPLADADLSFVIHTVDPVTCDEASALVELAVGLGETLASGAAGTPFCLRCRKDTGATALLGCASYGHALRPAAAGGLRREPVQYAAQPLLRDRAWRERLGARLAQLARLIEERAGGPQDIEGALIEGELVVLQTRPQLGLPTPAGEDQR